MDHEAASRPAHVPPDLIAIAHPDRLAARLDARLTPATLERLRACTRLQPRLAELVLAPGEAPSGPRSDSAVAAAFAAHPPSVVANLAGAIVHAKALKLVISGKEVAALAQAIGQETYSFGLKNADLADDRETDPEDLPAAIERDGLRCLGLALRAQPSSVRTAVLIQLPPGGIAERIDGDPAEIESSAEIVERVLSHLSRASRPPDDAE